MKLFSLRLLELRRLHRLTQKAIAERIGVSQPSYIRYERGICEPSQSNLIKIADIFDVSLDYLVGRTEY